LSIGILKYVCFFASFWENNQRQRKHREGIPVLGGLSEVGCVLGFVQLGVIPGGFRMDDRYEDIVLYYHTLQDIPVL
jgi:hypothetical protein